MPSRHAQRTIPPLPEFAAEVARSLGAAARMLDAGAYPSAAIAIGDHHVLLIRDHHWSLTLSLPASGTWSMQTVEEWRAAEPEIGAAVASHAETMSLADVIVAVARPGWTVSFPGVPIPAEAWVRKDDQAVGLFQQARSVWKGFEERWRLTADGTLVLDAIVYDDGAVPPLVANEIIEGDFFLVLKSEFEGPRQYSPSSSCATPRKTYEA